MTAALLAAYPEVFKGDATVVGVPYGCAQGMVDGLSCMSSGKDLSPQDWGNRVRAAAPGHVAGDSVPKISVWQGSADSTVNPMNAGEMVDEWTNVIGIDQTPEKSATVNGADYKGYADGSGTVLVEEYIIPGMDHGVAVDPQHGCGNIALVLLFAFQGEQIIVQPLIIVMLAVPIIVPVNDRSGRCEHLCRLR